MWIYAPPEGLLQSQWLEAICQTSSGRKVYQLSFRTGFGCNGLCLCLYDCTDCRFLLLKRIRLAFKTHGSVKMTLLLIIDREGLCLQWIPSNQWLVLWTNSHIYALLWHGPPPPLSEWRRPWAPHVPHTSLFGFTVVLLCHLALTGPAAPSTNFWYCAISSRQMNPVTAASTVSFCLWRGTVIQGVYVVFAVLPSYWEPQPEFDSSQVVVFHAYCFHHTKTKFWDFKIISF